MWRRCRPTAPLQRAAIDRLDAFGTTGLHDAIIHAIDEVQPAKGRRALVLLSDGNDRYSQATAADALDRARRADVMIFPVALGRTRPPLFAELATLTGGRSYHARDGAALPTRSARSHASCGSSTARLHADRAPVAGSNEWRSISPSPSSVRARRFGRATGIW